jgi:hypothetical protein
MGLGELDFTDEPGGLLFYHGNARGEKPGTLEFNPNTQIFKEDEELNVRDLDNLTFQHEVTRGQTPPNVESGVAIQALQEMDNRPVGPTYGDIELSWQEALELALCRAEQFYDEERVIHAVGRDRTLDVMRIRSLDLTGKIKVTVRAGSTVPRSRAAYQWLLIQLKREQVITDPKQLLRLMEIGGGTDLHTSYALDINAARVENYKMMTQEEIWPMPYEDHVIHVEEHNRWRKNPAFRDVVDAVQELFEQHVRAHIGMMQPVAPAPGMSPGGPGAPVGPVGGTAPGAGPEGSQASPRQPSGPEPRPTGAPLEQVGATQ